MAGRRVVAVGELDVPTDQGSRLLIGGRGLGMLVQAPLGAGEQHPALAVARIVADQLLPERLRLRVLLVLDELPSSHLHFVIGHAVPGHREQAQRGLPRRRVVGLGSGRPGKEKERDRDRYLHSFPFTPTTAPPPPAAGAAARSRPGPPRSAAARTRSGYGSPATAPLPARPPSGRHGTRVRSSPSRRTAGPAWRRSRRGSGRCRRWSAGR